jgi:hypothetical protein
LESLPSHPTVPEQEAQPPPVHLPVPALMTSDQDSKIKHLQEFFKKRKEILHALAINSSFFAKKTQYRESQILFIKTIANDHQFSCCFQPGQAHFQATVPLVTDLECILFIVFTGLTRNNPAITSFHDSEIHG